MGAKKNQRKVGRIQLLIDGDGLRIGWQRARPHYKGYADHRHEIAEEGCCSRPPRRALGVLQQRGGRRPHVVACTARFLRLLRQAVQYVRRH